MRKVGESLPKDSRTSSKQSGSKTENQVWRFEIKLEGSKIWKSNSKIQDQVQRFQDQVSKIQDQVWTFKDQIQIFEYQVWRFKYQNSKFEDQSSRYLQSKINYSLFKPRSKHKPKSNQGLRPTPSKAKIQA